MFITKKHIQRRALLKGAGVALGLPLLDAMFPVYDALLAWVRHARGERHAWKP